MVYERHAVIMSCDGPFALKKKKKKNWTFSSQTFWILKRRRSFIDLSMVVQGLLVHEDLLGLSRLCVIRDRTWDLLLNPSQANLEVPLDVLASFNFFLFAESSLVITPLFLFPNRVSISAIEGGRRLCFHPCLFVRPSVCEKDSDEILWTGWVGHKDELIRTCVFVVCVFMNLLTRRGYHS